MAESAAARESRSRYMSSMAWTMASGGWLAGEGRRVLARIEVGELAKAARRAVAADVDTENEPTMVAFVRSHG